MNQAAIPGMEIESERATRREAPKAIFEPVAGHQKVLFSKTGLRGQKNLFADIGVPDDLVAMPPDNNESGG